jgi:hypothetical protein
VTAITGVAGRPGGSKTRSTGAANRDYTISPPSGAEVSPHADWCGKTERAPGRSDVRVIVIAATADALVCVCRRVGVPCCTSRPSLDRSSATGSGAPTPGIPQGPRGRTRGPLPFSVCPLSGDTVPLSDHTATPRFARVAQDARPPDGAPGHQLQGPGGGVLVGAQRFGSVIKPRLRQAALCRSSRRARPRLPSLVRWRCAGSAQIEGLLRFECADTAGQAGDGSLTPDVGHQRHLDLEDLRTGVLY